MNNKYEIVIAIVKEAISRMGRTNGKSGSMSIILEALEKQVPKKPNNIVLPPPHCSKIFGECKVCSCKVGDNIDYCPECGQAIDWSEQCKNVM